MSYTWLWHTPLGMLLALMYEFMSITSLLHHWTALLLLPEATSTTNWQNEENINSIWYYTAKIEVQYVLSDNIYRESSITAILICKICTDLYDVLYIQHVLWRYVCGKICFQSKYKKNHLCACIPSSMLTWRRPRSGKDRSNCPLRARFEY